MAREYLPGPRRCLMRAAIRSVVSEVAFAMIRGLLLLLRCSLSASCGFKFGGVYEVTYLPGKCYYAKSLFFASELTDETCREVG
jgi:hypothetical protein